MKIFRSAEVEESQLEPQDRFYIHLELNGVDFFGLVSQEDFNTFKNFVIDEFIHSDRQLLIDELLIYELGKKFYCELNELLSPNKLKFNQVKILKDDEKPLELNIQEVNYPSKTLYGNNFRIGAFSPEDLENIINAIQCKKVYLDKYIGLYHSRCFKLFGLKFGFEVQENSSRVLDERQYLSLDIRINNQKELVFLTKELVKHLVFAYIGTLPNLELKNLPQFSYNEFYAQLAVSILQMMVNNLNQGIVQINSWEYSLLPYESYLVSKLSFAGHYFNIYFANLHSEFLDLVMEKKMLMEEKLFDKNYVVSVPVIYCSTEIAAKDLKTLKLGTTILFPHLKNKSCYINLIKNNLSAELLTETQVKIIS